MATLTGAHSTVEEPIGTGGNREDLSDVINDVSPTETPVLMMMGQTKAEAVNHEWLVDELEDAADNKKIEGEDTSATGPASRGRLGNYVQIMSKQAFVTGTQERVKKAGIKSEIAYQIARRLRAIKRDGEFAVVGQSNAKVAGTRTVAAEMASLDAYLVTNNQLAATSSDPTGDGTDVSDYAGTDRALTEAIFKAALQALFDNSGGNSNVNAVVSSTDKGIISTFDASATRNVTTDKKKLVASIDVYDGDFHTVKIVPDRYVKDGLAFIIDPEYLKKAELTPAFSYDLAKTGDSIKKEIIWEWTLEVCDERAHCLIGDLT
jgi:hypothetical protein